MFLELLSHIKQKFRNVEVVNIIELKNRYWLKIIIKKLLIKEKEKEKRYTVYVYYLVHQNSISILMIRFTQDVALVIPLLTHAESIAIYWSILISWSLFMLCQWFGFVLHQAEDEVTYSYVEHQRKTSIVVSDESYDKLKQ